MKVDGSASREDPPVQRKRIGREAARTGSRLRKTEMDCPLYDPKIRSGFAIAIHVADRLNRSPTAPKGQDKSTRGANELVVNDARSAGVPEDRRQNWVMSLLLATATSSFTVAIQITQPPVPYGWVPPQRWQDHLRRKGKAAGTATGVEVGRIERVLFEPIVGGDNIHSSVTIHVRRQRHTDKVPATDGEIQPEAQKSWS